MSIKQKKILLTFNIYNFYFFGLICFPLELTNTKFFGAIYFDRDGMIKFPYSKKVLVVKNFPSRPAISHSHRRASSSFVRTNFSSTKEFLSHL